MKPWSLALLQPLTVKRQTQGSYCGSILPLENMLFHCSSESLIAIHISCLCAKRCTSHPEDCVTFVGPWQWPKSISCSKETKNRRRTNCAKNSSVASLHLASASFKHRENRNSHCLKCEPKTGYTVNTEARQNFLHPLLLCHFCKLEELEYAPYMQFQARTAARLRRSGTPAHMAPAFKQCGNSQLNRRSPKFEA